VSLLKSTNYSSFRKHLKRHSEAVCARLQDKYDHMERINKHNVFTNEEHTLEQLGELFKIKFNSKETSSQSMLKDNARVFFGAILKKHLVTSPTELEVEEMLRVIQLREQRVQLLGVLNGMCCYHRNLAMDLRVIGQMEFKFHLDDEQLINANKQVLENFEKAVKDTQTYFSRDTEESPVRLSEEEFVQHQAYEKSKLYKKDRVLFEHFGEKIPHVLVSNGQRPKHRVLYEEALQDIEAVEERLMRHCTVFINRYERFLRVRSLPELVDRVELLAQMYQLELEYQFEKLTLIENYYYLYENAKEPLQAYTISANIVKLIHQEPALDLEEPSFVHAYRLSIDALAQESKVATLMTAQLEKAEAESCRTFHDKFARTLNIPLTLQAYLYGDLEKKTSKPGGKLQRLNSLSSSRLSKDKNQREDK
jgi:hypothetical protein